MGAQIKDSRKYSFIECLLVDLDLDQIMSRQNKNASIQTLQLLAYIYCHLEHRCKIDNDNKLVSK